MESLFTDVNWLAVGVGTILSFLLGWLWYSPKLFGTKWAEGVGVELGGVSGPPIKAMLAQFGGTFLLAWVIGITATTDDLALAILVALTIAAFIKASGLYAQKSTYAVIVETFFILAMVVVMILTHAII